MELLERKKPSQLFLKQKRKSEISKEQFFSRDTHETWYLDTQEGKKLPEVPNLVDAEYCAGANLQSYYAEIQADYISTGEYNLKIKVDWSENPSYDWHSVTLLNGKKIEMKTGICAVSFTEGSGYSIEYECNKGDTECHLSLPVKQIIIKINKEF